MSVCPGAHGGVDVSPAKAAIAKTDINVKDRASLLRYVMFFSLGLVESVLRNFLNNTKRVSADRLIRSCLTECMLRGAQ